ncbi:hypothetical protein [Phocoenobacter atlanticus]|uniref:COG4648 family protein n=1 Tax=Phocoenobacter atlanticus TaxID=3416742 RepID=UPI0027737606|nr:hypothetical protein [Pasteurella atlantica]MDP8100213.1 hypothetical protein [Pasteurella atlantica]
MLNLIINTLLTLTSIAYPIIWLFKGNTDLLFVFPYIVGILWLFKGVTQAVGFQRFFAFFMAILLIIVGLTRSIETMYFYPILISGLMLVIFGGSLFSKQSIIERFARLKTPDLPQVAILYTRKVTQVWCGFFIINIAITLFFIWQKNETLWAIYTGVISYLLMGILMIGEWLIRQKVMRKHNDNH